jgi:hypothetical protein
MLNSLLLLDFFFSSFCISLLISALFYLEQIFLSNPEIRSRITISDYPPSSWRTSENWIQFLWTNFPHKDRRRAVGAGDAMVSSIYLAIAVPLCVVKPSLVRIPESSAIKFVPTLATRDLASQFPAETLVLRSKI